MMILRVTSSRYSCQVMCSTSMLALLSGPLAKFESRLSESLSVSLKLEGQAVGSLAIVHELGQIWIINLEAK